MGFWSLHVQMICITRPGVVVRTPALGTARHDLWTPFLHVPTSSRTSLVNLEGEAVSARIMLVDGRVDGSLLRFEKLL